jgi:single-strand DNA-binding protein
MNSLANKVNLIGRLGADPEIKTLDNGKKMARFPIATDEVYRDSEGNRVEKTHWHQIVVWEPAVGRVEKLLAKGKQIALEGKLISNSYTDKEGNKRFSTDVHLQEFLLLERKPVEA